MSCSGVSSEFQVSLLVLLSVCDGRHGALTFTDVADTGPLSVHRLLPQRHLHKHKRSVKRLMVKRVYDSFYLYICFFYSDSVKLPCCTNPLNKAQDLTFMTLKCAHDNHKSSMTHPTLPASRPLPLCGRVIVLL